MIDSRMAKLYLKWFNRIPIEFNKDKDFDTYISKWSCYTRTAMVSLAGRGFMAMTLRKEVVVAKKKAKKRGKKR